MINKRWEELPKKLQNEKVKMYYDLLSKKRAQLNLKRFFDILLAVILLFLLLPVFLVISLAIKLDSEGPVFFRQTRITQYGKEFNIFKFRTMVRNAEQIGTQVTLKGDPRVTRVGHFLRKYRLDEFPQLLNIIIADMTFVGTRPEVPKFVEHYTDEMLATLLLPAGVTSEASLSYKDEQNLLRSAEDVDWVYTKIVLPLKMEINLSCIKDYCFIEDVRIIYKTISKIFTK